MKPPATEIERRRPVWAVMSELFLDTALDAADHDRIAAVLAASGYGEGELDAILWGEVCPVLWSNLACVAGEWGGFDMGAVELQILSRPAGRVRRWWSYVNGGRIARADWEQVRQRLAAVTAIDPRVEPFYNVTLVLCGLMFCSDCKREALYASRHAPHSDGRYLDQARAMESEGWVLLPADCEVACPACAAKRRLPRAAP